MSTVDPNMSLLSRGRLSGGERLGATFIGVGLLALLVAFLGARIQPYIPLAFALAGFVSGGALLMKKDPAHATTVRILLGIGLLSFVLMALVSFGVLGTEDFAKKGQEFVYWIFFALIFGVTSVGAVIFYKSRFGRGPAGVRNNGTVTGEATRKQGLIAWILTILFTGFYVTLYWFPDNLAGLMEVVKPLKKAITGNDGGAQWFLYTLSYTMLVLVMGIRFMYKYRHSRYQKIRTLSVTFFQLVLAFYLPFLMQGLNASQNTAFQEYLNKEYRPAFAEYKATRDAYFMNEDSIKANVANKAEREANAPALKAAMESQKEKIQKLDPAVRAHAPKVGEHYFTYFFPLKYDAFWPDMWKSQLGTVEWDGVFDPDQSKAGFGMFGIVVMAVFVFMSLVGVVVLTYFFGKRWYCSWVCGCGGLAETAGDPFRHLSDKSVKAWRVERVLIHSVLATIVGLTVLLLVDWKLGVLGGWTSSLKSAYGFLIGSMFAGVVGTGFYPILGSRGWCRFGCPQAAVLGILQKYFSRFRITTNGGQCISCGNCSTYCEMGIDVKAYAQRGQDIVRASCVGCGLCSAVCPRGVLNLENGPQSSRNLDPHTVSGIAHPGDK